MIKNYIINQLTQISAWLGFGVIIASIFLPRSFILVLGACMVVFPDNKFQKIFAEWSPYVKKHLSEWS